MRLNYHCRTWEQKSILGKYSSHREQKEIDLKLEIHNEFYSVLEKTITNKELVITDDVTETIDCDLRIVVATPGCVTFNNLHKLQESLSLIDAATMGWILVDTNKIS